jgi:hypothetical protein
MDRDARERDQWTVPLEIIGMTVSTDSSRATSLDQL